MKKNALFPLLGCVIFLLGMRPAHPLKMCVCDVKYQKDTRDLVFKFRFFWDDLEATLEKKTGKSLDLRQINTANQQVVTDFILQHFQLNVNQIPVSFYPVGAELQDPVLVMEYKTQGFQAAERYDIDLKNSILLDVFPDQYNLVRFDFFGNGNLETLRFERQERHLTKQIRP
jgi:hypothetical protein